MICQIPSPSQYHIVQNEGKFSINTINPNSKFDIYIYIFVADLPDKKPSITGLPNSMKAGVGDGVDATCTSWQSNPPANLSWFINGEPVRNNKGKHRSSNKSFWCTNV